MYVMYDVLCKPKQPYQRKMHALSVCRQLVLHFEFIYSFLLSVNTKSLKCMVYLTSDVDFSTLIKDARGFHAMEHCSKAIELTVLYNPLGPHKQGAFKRAGLGCLDQPILGDSNSVMVKQCFYKGVDNETTPFDNHSQITKLSMEINCLRWSSALMCLTYNYIDGHIKNHGLAPFAIPRMRFVRSALAIVHDTRDTFLLEEVIDEDNEGDFIKYIGNGSAKPLEHLEGEKLNQAIFLCFCQHLQYNMTKNLAFVSDFQGMLNVLYMNNPVTRI